MVLELPLPFAVGSAGFFARGGVETLASLGLVDILVFGSECGDTDLLLQTADALLSSETERTIQAFMKQGLSFPSARERAVRACFSDTIADVLKAPNNVLGVEYILASKKLGAPLAFYSVPRVGTAHDAQTPQDDFASASFLRTQMKKEFSVDRYVPASALELLREATEKGECPADFQKLETAVLAFLRKASPADFAGVPDVTEGIDNRILDAVRTADSLQAVFDNAKTKRYTHARIRRIVLCAFLGVTKKMQEAGVPYLRVLGANERGLQLLKRAEETAKKEAEAEAKRLADKKKTQEQLSLLRKELGALLRHRLHLKRIPSFSFEYDNTPEKASRVESIFKIIEKEHENEQGS